MTACGRCSRCAGPSPRWSAAAAGGNTNTCTRKPRAWRGNWATGRCPGNLFTGTCGRFDLFAGSSGAGGSSRNRTPPDQCRTLPEHLLGFVAGRPPRGPGLAERWLDSLQQIQKLQNERDASQWYKDELKRVVAEYTSLVDEHAVLPLANAAFAQSDPRRQCAELQMAHVVRLLQGMMPSLHVSLADSMKNGWIAIGSYCRPCP